MQLVCVGCCMMLRTYSIWLVTFMHDACCTCGQHVKKAKPACLLLISLTI